MSNANETLAAQFFAGYRSDPESADIGQDLLRYAAHLVVQKPPFELSDQDLEDGITDGGLDGGIDAVYAIFNGEALENDSELLSAPTLPPSVRAGQGRLDIVVIQSKARGAGTTSFEKLVANLPRLMNLGPPSFAAGEFNEILLERFELARAAWSRVASYGCALNFYVAVVTLSDPFPLSAETEAKMAELDRSLRESLPGVTILDIQVIGAPGIVVRQRMRPPSEFQLPYQKCFTSESGHVALVRLADYVKFVTDEGGRVRTSLLDENVRDFQGMVEVNSGIRKSLESPGQPPFWWLNNGVTIICQSATLVGEEFRLREPKIVNGLQTTRVIHDHLSNREGDPAGQQLLQVRILSTADSSGRDAVIRATNSQTAVQSASLRATDEIQRSIELYFTAQGLFYDRRKGSFRDAPSGTVVVSIRDLGQALTAAVLGRPDEARGKPSSLLKDDDRYKSIFNPDFEIELYSFMAKLMARVTDVLASEEAEVNSVQRRYLRFHIVSAVLAARLGYWGTGAQRLRPLWATGWMPNDAEVLKALAEVLKVMDEYVDDESSTLEKATKAQGFTTRLAGHMWREE